MEELSKKNVENILIAGIETHVCVLQTALDLRTKGFNIYVIADAVMSRRSYDHNIALQRMAYSGLTISTTEMSIFEICRTSNRKEFKEISSIIKRQQ